MIILLHLQNDNWDRVTFFYFLLEFRMWCSLIISNNKNTYIYDIILFEELFFQNTLIRNYYALLYLLVQGQASQENLLVRQVLWTSGERCAWQFHSPATFTGWHLVKTIVKIEILHVICIATCSTCTCIWILYTCNFRTLTQVISVMIS
jgi:hypothetical protein